MSPYLPKIISFAACAVIFLVVAQKVWSLWRGRQSRDWPYVIGKVRVARIVAGRWPDEDGRRGDEYFELEVQYEYRVRATAYIGTRYSFGSERFSRYDDAIDALRDIRVGREVRVYYEARQPRHAVLKTG
jgi:hypothetical protein